MIKLTIPTQLMDLNTYINFERSNKFIAARCKKENTDLCQMFAKKIEPIRKRVKVIITWYCCNQKKDPDNVAFAKKFILDGLVAAGVLQDDGWKNIEGFEDRFEVDKENPRVEIEIREVQ